MTPKDLKYAVSLYKRFKVTGPEYKSLAKQYGIPIAELNRMCSRTLQLSENNRKPRS